MVTFSNQAKCCIYQRIGNKMCKFWKIFISVLICKRLI